LLLDASLRPATNDTLNIGDGTAFYNAGFFTYLRVGNTLLHSTQGGLLYWNLPTNAGASGYVLGTDGSGNLGWVINGTGIGCSGTCSNGNWARFTDTTHIEGVAAPTWSSVGADQGGAAAAVQGLLGIQLVDVQSAMRGTSYTSSASYEYSTISSVGFTALGGQRIIVHGVASAATYTTNGSCTLAIFLGSSQIGPTIYSNTNNHRTTLSTVVNYPGLSAESYTVYLKMSTGEEGSTCAIDANASYLMVERYAN
jgi:hypothetical protein